MQLGMVGLGRMGANLVRRLMRDGHHCVVYDVNKAAVDDLVAEGATGATDLDEFVDKLQPPRTAWLMLPAAITGRTLDHLASMLEPDDTVIDGGNSYYRDDIARAKQLVPHRVAQRVIHVLELVKVEVQHRKSGTVAAVPSAGLHHRLDKYAPIGQSGQSVEPRGLDQAGFEYSERLGHCAELIFAFDPGNCDRKVVGGKPIHGGRHDFHWHRDTTNEDRAEDPAHCGGNDQSPYHEFARQPIHLLTFTDGINFRSHVEVDGARQCCDGCCVEFRVLAEIFRLQISLAVCGHSSDKTDARHSILGPGLVEIAHEALRI